MTVRILYETHSISTDNERGIATGWLPGELSASGRELAAALGERRAGPEVSAVYVSDLTRAVQTAEIAFGTSTIPVILDPRLRECNYGDLNGAPVEAIQSERARRITLPFPGGESYEQVVKRTRDFLDDLCRERDGQTVVLISHSANRWAIEHLVNGIPLRQLVDADFDWRPGWEFVVECARSGTPMGQ